MASHAITAAGAASGGLHKTLTGTTADDVTVTCDGVACRIEVFNRSTTNTITARFGGTAPTALADGTYHIPPDTGIAPRVGPGVTKVWVVGNGDAYSVTPLPQDVW